VVSTLERQTEYVNTKIETTSRLAMLNQYEATGRLWINRIPADDEILRLRPQNGIGGVLIADG
jgi:hypothetical protein